MEVSDMKAMREALELVRDAHYVGEDNNGDGYEGFNVECDDGTGRPLICVVEEALAAPPRNCDVGTAREQLDRYGLFCQNKCPICENRFSCHVCGERYRMKCMMEWSQMPYAPKEGSKE